MDTIRTHRRNQVTGRARTRRLGRRLVSIGVVAGLAGVVPAVGAGARSLPMAPVVPSEVSAALDLGVGQLVSATLDGDPVMYAVRTTSSIGFPTKGGSYLALSTGDVSEIDGDDHPSTALGLNNGADGHDKAALHLTLSPPSGTNCLSFTAVFASEEFPEFVGTSFNDTFTAELGSTNLTYDSSARKVIAPNNFAFDVQNNVIDVNTVFGVTVPPNTTIDGATPAVVATSPFVVDGSGHIELYLSVQDLGDSIYDSVVFLDQLGFRADADCAKGSGLLVGSSFSPLVPGRILETRPGETPTVDGQFYGGGRTFADDVLELQVAGRADVPLGAGAAVLNITATGGVAPGYVTVYPCDQPRPNAANLNYTTGQTIPNVVIAKLDSSGKVCLYTYSSTHLVADVNGYLLAGSFYAPMTPARILETRVGYPATVDGQFTGSGPLGAGQTLELLVAGRADVPANATSAVMNIAVTGAQGDGYLTVWPCGQPRPVAANLNYSTGQTIPNVVNAKIGVGGKVCIFTYATTDIVVDLNGFYRNGSTYEPIVPARVLETRPGETPTIDGLAYGGGRIPDGGTLELQIAGRPGVPADAAAAVVNIAVTGSSAAGFLTVWPCGEARPTAANLNYEAGQTIPNLVLAKLGAGGKICIFALKATHVVADLNGYYPL